MVISIGWRNCFLLCQLFAGKWWWSDALFHRKQVCTNQSAFCSDFRSTVKEIFYSPSIIIWNNDMQQMKIGTHYFSCKMHLIQILGIVQELAINHYHVIIKKKRWFTGNFDLTIINNNSILTDIYYIKYIMVMIIVISDKMFHRKHVHNHVISFT